MDIIFCKTRADPEFYRSYTDFWRLVELAGFEVVWLDEVEPGRDAVYVVTPRNGELPGILPRLQGDRRCKFVWWCLERPDVQGSVTRGKALEKGIDELWLSDRWLTQIHERHGWGPVRFVPVGSHEGLGTKECSTFVYDWTHLSYANPRRQAVYDKIAGRCMPNIWPPERDELLQATAIMVNVHQDRWPILEPLRFALAAAHGMFIVSEEAYDPWPYRRVQQHRGDAKFLSLEEIPSYMKECRGLLSFAGAWRNPHYIWQRMTQDFEFGKCVKEAVACLLK